MLHSDITEEILGAFFKVYELLAPPRYLESVYQRAMVVELRLRRIPFVVQPPVEVWYRGEIVGEFRPDFAVRDLVIAELKAVHGILPKHEAQMLNYLRATDKEVGLLLNFGPTPTFKRLILTNDRKERPRS